MRQCLMILLLTPLCGCDVPYGYEAVTMINRKHEVSCISEALAEFGPVKYNNQSAIGMRSKRGSPVLSIDTWVYGKDHALKVQIYQVTDGWEFHNGNGRFASPDEKPSLKRAVPTIARANEVLKRKCDLPVSGLAIETV